MLRVVIKVLIEQQAQVAFPNRNKKLQFDFVNAFECADSWENLTNKAKVVLPKSIVAKDENGKPYNLSGAYKNIGGFITNVDPLFLRGDKISITAGYKFKNSAGFDMMEVHPLFKGWIAKVEAKIPITLYCEDNMWKLKQVAARGGNHGLFSGSTYTIEKILRELIANAGLTYNVNITTKTKIGDFRVQNETIAQVLARLRKEYFFESYFRLVETPLGSGNFVDTLFAGSLVYSGLPDVQTQSFKFQDNIISDDLEYSRKDDITLSAIAKNTIETPNGTTKDGNTKTKKTRLEVLVIYQNGNPVAKVIQKQKGVDFPPNTDGERFDFTFKGVTNINDLATAAKQKLIQYYYTGLKGSFTTFGLPFVRMGDQVTLADNVQKEREGTYKVKSVEYSGGVDGLRQKIHLHYRIPLAEAL